MAGVSTHSIQAFNLSQSNKRRTRKRRLHFALAGAGVCVGAMAASAAVGVGCALVTNGSVLPPNASATVGTFVEAVACSMAMFGEIEQPHSFLPKYTVEPPIQNGYLHAAPVCGCAVAMLSCRTLPLENVNSKQLLGDAAQ